MGAGGGAAEDLSMKQRGKVAQVASWDGWCSPCEREDRPLVLTRSGPSGLLAWLAGLGDDDRILLLTCRVCGRWQVVPRREEDDPEVVLVDEAAVEAVARIVAAAQVVAAPVEPAAAPAPVPAPRTEPTPAVRPERPVLLRGRLADVPAVCAQTRAATTQLLSAARTAEQQRVTPRSAPLDRSRRRTGPAPRRPERSATTVRVPRARVEIAPPAPTSIALPSGTVLDLLASGHQVVLVSA